MMNRDNELLKQEVRQYWDTHPCGTQFTDLKWGSREFFNEVERFRYESQPFMDSLIGFRQYAGKRLLEIGCGLGTDLLQFARAGAVVTGIDLTPRSVELVKQRFALEELPVEAAVADAEGLPFPNEVFDVVYSFGVLHHTPNTQKAIDEIHRVLKPGGEIIIMLYHKRSLHVLLGVPLFAFLGMVRGNGGGRTVTDEWIRIFDGSENPLGKAYSMAEARHMFSGFSNLRFKMCDPIRRRFPSSVNWFNQKLLAPFLGFYLIIRGTK